MPFWKNGRRISRPRPGCPETGGPASLGLGGGWLAVLGWQRQPRPARWPRAFAGWLIPVLLGVGLADGMAGVHAQPASGATWALETDPILSGNQPKPFHPASALGELPPDLLLRPGRQLVLQRGRRRLFLVQDGLLLELFPVAVGRPGWETPLGSFAVLEKIPNPTWQHPQRPLKIGAGPTNPLGSRWIGFWRDCNLRKPWEGEQPLAVPSCASIGFHGTPQRGSVGRAVSHGCVRLYEEDVRRLFEQVEVGTQVTVVP